MLIDALASPRAPRPRSAVRDPRRGRTLRRSRRPRVSRGLAMAIEYDSYEHHVGKRAARPRQPPAESASPRSAGSSLVAHAEDVRSAKRRSVRPRTSATSAERTASSDAGMTGRGDAVRCRCGSGLEERGEAAGGDAEADASPSRPGRRRSASRVHSTLAEHEGPLEHDALVERRDPHDRLRPPSGYCVSGKNVAENRNIGIDREVHEVEVDPRAHERRAGRARAGEREADEQRAAGPRAPPTTTPRARTTSIVTRNTVE